jgi:glycosyltransferase involved in cell wall biosynthesis
MVRGSHHSCGAGNQVTMKPLRICIVGKYPPIEGGVSATTYWLARGLASRGHEIHVVTNADEVEDRYRMQLDCDDAGMLQPRFDNGGSVRAHHVESFDPIAMAHIPVANPYFTRLASLATDVIRRYECEVIFAHYLEPYGMAGWFAAQRCRRPLLIRHAGSDIDRLARVPDLGLAYKEILRDADAVLTRPRLVRRFVGMGVLPSRIVEAPPYLHDSRFFSPHGAALDLKAVAICDGAGRPLNSQDTAIPTFGVYGKVGAAKGTFDLITALGRLAADGRSFRLAAMVGSEFGAIMRTSLVRSHIAERTLILPYLPNWRVPAFIRACTAVCFLERDFPVAIHGPMIAREVLTCGTCLIVSKEVADRQVNREQLASGVHLLVVTDPRDTDELTDVLRTVVDDPAWARRIGTSGAEAIGKPGAYERFVVSWEGLFERYARHASSVVGLGSPAGPAACRQALEVAVPSLLAYAETLGPAIVEQFLNNCGDSSLPGCALRFCSFLGESLPAAVAEERRAVFAEALRYTAACLRVGFDVPGAPPPFAVADDLHDRTFNLRDAAALYPVRSNSAVVEEFDYEVSSVFDAGRPSEATGDDPLGRAEARHCLVLFQRTVNLVRCELEVNPATVALLELCDGGRTTEEVVDAMAAMHGSGQDVRELVMDGLRRLYALGVVVFGRIDPVWGWRKGARSDPAALPPLRRAVSATLARQAAKGVGPLYAQ